ncbi:MAG: helix-turn-helix domain-containing protein [Actinobacteria bacterium]|nr:helix-turn-helix domain-containing protein [Actinomycetota bacterium]
MSLATRYEQTYTVEEVAELLRHSPGGVRAMIRRGALRAIKVGGRYLIPESALDEIGLASIRVFEDIDDPATYAAEVRARNSRKPDGAPLSDAEFLAGLEAAD